MERGSSMEKWKPRIQNFLMITLGCVMTGAGISLFLDPNQLAPGGATGISIILSHVTRLPTGTLLMCINIPLLIIGAWKLGGKFLLSTLYGTAVISLVTNLLQAYGPVTKDLFLATVSGAILNAVGMAMVLKAGATTGGTDIVARLLKLRYKHIKTSTLFLLMDSVIIAVSAVVFKRIDVALYAAVEAILFSKVFDYFVYGSDSARVVHIISDKPEDIAKRVLNELEIGVTYVKGEGAYTEKDKRILLCVARKQLYPKLKEIVEDEDDMAFMIVSWATDIYGEGFKSHGKQEI